MSEEIAALRAENERLRAQLDEARAALDKRREFVAQVMDAEDRARRRIAQLIHDDALQSLLAANQELMEAAPGRAQVTRAHEVVSASIAELRDALLALHPVTLERGGFEQALGAVARRAERQGGFDVNVYVERDALGRNDELALALARELLANATHHSGADQVIVRLSAQPDAVTLEVTDDGRGIDPKRPDEALAEGHMGLASVTQRVEAIGGQFLIESPSAGGTMARAVLPDAR